MTNEEIEKNRLAVVDTKTYSMWSLLDGIKVKDLIAEMQSHDPEAMLTIEYEDVDDFDISCSDDSYSDTRYDIVVTTRRLETDDEVIHRMDEEKAAKKAARERKKKLREQQKQIELETIKKLAAKHKIKIEVE